MKMASSALSPLPADYQRVCAQFNRQYAEDMARWADNPKLIPRMFYAFVFQDALHFGLCDENIMANLADVIEDYRWLGLRPS